MPSAYIYQPGGRTIPRQTHPQRAAENGEALRKSAGSGTGVRSYLLKRFRPRRTEEMKCVTTGMFRQIRSAVLKYTKEDRIADLPERLGEEFLTKVNERFTDNLEGDCHLSIVARNGKIHLMIWCQPFWGDINCHLAIGGLQRIEDEYVKDAATRFLNAFITNNDLFTPFHNTVWRSLYGHVEYDGEQIDDMGVREAFRCLGDLFAEEEALKYQLSLIKEDKPLDRDTMIHLLENVQPQNIRDGALIDLLREGVPYVFEKRWTTEDADDYRCRDAYSNVLISSGDYFPITLKDNPIQSGYTIINECYEGDLMEAPPSIHLILENDGTLTNLDDRNGFETFTNRLTQTLNSYYDA